MKQSDKVIPPVPINSVFKNGLDDKQLAPLR
jgi:hypothetical protein